MTRAEPRHRLRELVGRHADAVAGPAAVDRDEDRPARRRAGRPPARGVARGEVGRRRSSRSCEDGLAARARAAARRRARGDDRAQRGGQDQPHRDLRCRAAPRPGASRPSAPVATSTAPSARDRAPAPAADARDTAPSGRCSTPRPGTARARRTAAFGEVRRRGAPGGREEDGLVAARLLVDARERPALAACPSRCR